MNAQRPPHWAEGGAGRWPATTGSPYQRWRWIEIDRVEDARTRCAAALALLRRQQVPLAERALVAEKLLAAAVRGLEASTAEDTAA